MLLSALKNGNQQEGAFDGRRGERGLKKEIKQTQETYEMAPADREDIRSEAVRQDGCL